MPSSRRLFWRCRTPSTEPGRPSLRRARRGGAGLIAAACLLGLSVGQSRAAEPDGGVPTGQVEEGPAGEGGAQGGTASGAGDASRGQARFEAALRLYTAGKSPDAAGASAAAAALEQLARELPQDEIAPEALFEAAQLSDEQLGRPEQAQKLYAELLQRYPSSRLVRRAESRLAQLRQGLRTGADVLTRFQHILRTTQESSADRIRELAALARERPEFALADQTLYLLASAQLRAGQEAAAAATFSALESRFPASEWTAYGHKAQADALIEKGACTKARTHLAALAQRQGLIWTSAAAEGFAHCRELDHRRLWLRLALGYLGVLLLGLLAKGRRMLWPPPFEVFYYTPVAAFMVLVSLAIKGGLYLVPVLLLAGLGVALNWLGAAAAAQRAAAGQRGGPLRQLAHVGIGLLLRALAAAAICYVVIDTQGLFDLLMETVRNGADE